MINNTEATTFGDWAYIAIAKHHDKILKHEVRVLQDKNTEDLHQMRVGMRRLRSTIAAFSPALDLPLSVTEKRIGKIAQILGNLRDLDVLKEILITDYEPYFNSREKGRLKLVLEYLKSQRKQAYKDVKNILKKQSYSQFKYDLKIWLETPQYQTIAQLNIKQVLPDLLLPQLSSLFLHPGLLMGVKIIDGIPEVDEEFEILDCLSSNQEKLLHDLRKISKKSRYNLELFTDLYGDIYRKYLQEIKAIQEVLGGIQDSFVLIYFMNSCFDAGVAKEMPKFYKLLRGKRQEEWKKWQKLQQHFFERRYLQDFRMILNYP